MLSKGSVLNVGSLNGRASPQTKKKHKTRFSMTLNFEIYCQQKLLELVFSRILHGVLIQSIRRAGEW